MFTDMDDAAAERHMVACVNESLSLYLMSNARFMCERLVADYPSEVTGVINHWQISAATRLCL